MSRLNKQTDGANNPHIAVNGNSVPSSKMTEKHMLQTNEVIEDIDLTLPVDEISEIVQHVDDLYTLVDIANSEMNGEKREEVIQVIKKRISELKAEMEMEGEKVE